ncbi:redoxin domain-containing protein [Pedobacter sp.]
MEQWQRRLLIFLLFLSSSMAYGQTNFNILGHGQKMKDGDSLFLSYKEEGRNVFQTVTASNGKFTFTGLIRTPVKANLYRNQNPKYADFINDWVEVYIEPGIIKVNSSDTLSNAIVSGTPLNTTLQLLQNRLSSLKEKMRKIKDPDLFTDEERKDTALLNHSKRVIEQNFYEGTEIKLAFAADYANSQVSLDLLENLSRINSHIFKVEKVYAMLPEHFKRSAKGLTISDRINKKRQVMAGSKAIDFTMKDSNGKAIDLASLSGKYVLLDFWASWCGPCREEHPNLIAAYEKYRAKGFTILSVSIDTEKSKWLEAIVKDKLTWVQVADLKGNKGEVYLKYGITSIPANFLIDPDGIVIAKDLKGEILKSKLTALFEAGK